MVIRKKAVITTRVVFDKKTEEMRDCLDEALVHYFATYGFIIYLMPNFQHTDLVSQFIDQLNPGLIILSGGNNVTPSLYKGEPLEMEDTSLARDKNEMRLLDVAIDKKIKTIGICRGMQMINVYFGGRLICLTHEGKSSVEHVATKHPIIMTGDEDLNLISGEERLVNSYHQWGIMRECLGNDLVPLAHADDGSIELIKHRKISLLGMMWHPERKHSDVDLDRRIINSFLKTDIEREIFS